MNSYWGGAASAAGGALVAGAAARLRTRITWRDSVLLAAGMVVLSNTRPYEGFLISAVVCGWLAIQMVRRRVGWKLSLLQVAAPMLGVLVVAGAGMAVYFKAVTGSPWRLPHQVYYEQYAASPAFVFQKVPPEPLYRHQALLEAFEALRRDYTHFESVSGAVSFTFYKLRMLGSFYLGPVVFVPFLALIPLWRGRCRLAMVAVAVTLAGILLIVPIQLHYGAPLTVFLVILTVQTLRHLWIAQTRGNPLGLFLVPAVPVVCLGFVVLSAVSSEQAPGNLGERVKLVERLTQSGGRHLVLVHYGAQHPFSEEWVYNRADIDRSDIVWARDMGPAANAELLRYYSNRTHWLVFPDSRPVQPILYAEIGPQRLSAATGALRP